MKKLKTFLAILLALSFLLCFASCGENNPEETTTKQEETTTKQEEVTTTPAPKTDPVSLSINSTNISEYTIVYAPSEYDNNRDVTSVMRSSMEGETAKNFACADYLIKIIKKNTGVTLSMIPEATYKNNQATYPHAIFVGKTSFNTAHVPANNNFSSFIKDTMHDYYAVCADMDKFNIVLMENGNISICGGTFGTTYHAMDAIDTWLKGHVAEGTNATWDETVNLSGTYHIKIVACIGDSITQGTKASNQTYFSYVQNLNRLYWEDYFFINFGVSGKTMRSDLTDAYQSCTAYPQLMADKVKYDIVTLMLGTNDSDRDKTNWNAAAIANFKTEMESFISTLYAKNNNTTFIVMNCPAYYGTGTFGSSYVVNLQLETAKEIYKKGYNLYFFNMRSFSSTEMGSTMFPDTLHPGDEGYAVMATGIGKMIDNIMKGKTNKYLIDLSK